MAASTAPVTDRRTRRRISRITDASPQLTNPVRVGKTGVPIDGPDRRASPVQHAIPGEARDSQDTMTAIPVFMGNRCGDFRRLRPI
jgi:hypothetical protein